MKYPQVTAKIVKTLKDLCISGIPVSVPLGHLIMLAIIQKDVPQLLNNKFYCLEKFVHSFYESVLYWTPHQAMHAATHIPLNATELCEHTFFCLVYAMKWENILVKLVVNVDQMGMYGLLNNSRTFHNKGANQIDAVAKDKKQAYTLLVASTASGDFLPFQQVWGSKTICSTPSDVVPGMADACEQGFHFTVTASEKNPTSHFSTLKMMKEWVEEIMVPYVKGVVEADPDLNKNQQSILFINAYSVHTGREFHQYVFTEHLNIVLIFMPANCTGIFQPADVGLQHSI